MINKLNGLWSVADKFLRILEIILVIMAALAILTVPAQLKEWRNEEQSRNFDLLLRLDDRLQNKTDQAIFSVIEKNKALLQPQGKFSPDNLDQYLDDLTSIQYAYNRNLINIDSFYNWFSDYFILTARNKEINNYLIKIRKESPDYYAGFEEIADKLYKYGSK